MNRGRRLRNQPAGLSEIDIKEFKAAIVAT
jgi:hypothetical protein